MGERTKRGVVKMAKALEKLAVGRDGAIQVCREAKINTPEFKAANHVVDSIDDLAASLTGNEQHFHLTGHGSALLPSGDDD